MKDVCAEVPKRVEIDGTDGQVGGVDGDMLALAALEGTGAEVVLGLSERVGREVLVAQIDEISVMCHRHC